MRAQELAGKCKQGFRLPVLHNFLSFDYLQALNAFVSISEAVVARTLDDHYLAQQDAVTVPQSIAFNHYWTCEKPI
jgi:hypothetical protein